ncbi:MAG: Smr/MutS family protein [Bacteroidota bacterium]
MNIGDKVKLSNTKETGIITNFLRGDQVEVELDGWNSKQIFSKNELRLVDQPIENKEVAKPKSKNNFEKGVFLAFIPQKLPTGEYLELYAINNTDWDLPFSLTIDKTRTKSGLMAGFLNAGAFQKHIEKLKIENFEEWKSMTFSAIYHSESVFEPKAMLYSQKKFHASTFFQNKTKVPFLETEGYLFQIDDKPFEINPAAIQEKMLGESPKIVSETNVKPADEFDLHIEKLSNNFKQLGNAEIFAMQIDAFEKHLDKAIATGLEELIFIHGIGDWKLKKAIHEILEFHKNVADFGMANEQKYGAGATFVKIK